MLPIQSLSLEGGVFHVVRQYGDSSASSEIRLLTSSSRGAYRVVTLAKPTAATARRYAEAATLAAQLEEHEVFAQFAASGPTTAGDSEYMAWAERWVRGVRLEDHLAAWPRAFSVTDLQQLVLDLTEALSALRKLGLVHGALTTRSIIWAEPLAGAMEPRYRYKVADLSTLRVKTKGEPSEDDLAVLRVVASGFNSLVGRSDLAPEARRYLRRLRDFIVKASEDLERGDLLALAPMRTLSEPQMDVPIAAATTLSDPFNFLSTEHFNSDVLVHRLFAESPWIDEVARPIPTLIVGPRGCGKSMVLRWLSVRTQLAGPEPVEALDGLEVGGFYVSCASEVQSRVARFAEKVAAQANKVSLIHYLNMVLLREVVSTLSQMSLVDAPHWGVTDAAGQALWQFVTTEVNPTAVSAAGVPVWDQLRDVAHAQLNLAHDALEGRSGPPRFTVGSFAHDLARTLTERVPYFAKRRVAYCLDDYSSHRIPESVQEVFNEVVFSVRSGNHVFKISAENKGFHPYTSNGARIDIQRELVEIDFGSFYLEAMDSDRRRVHKFSRDLLANRLEAAGWKGTPEQLIGSSALSGVEFARRARDGKRPKYSGLDAISELCTGDVAHLILVYKNIFREGRANKTQTTMIDAKHQDKAIRDTSRYLIELIRSHVPQGVRMLALVEHFAQLAKWAQNNGPLLSAHGGEEPRMQTRIEIDGLIIDDVLGKQSKPEDPFIRELLRRAIFVELKPGVARRGVGTNAQNSTRLQLRRIYLPAHELSYSKNLAWTWTRHQFKEFLTDPEDFGRKQRGRIVHRKQRQQTLPGFE